MAAMVCSDVASDGTTESRISVQLTPNLQVGQLFPAKKLSMLTLLRKFCIRLEDQNPKWSVFDGRSFLQPSE